MFAIFVLVIFLNTSLAQQNAPPAPVKEPPPAVPDAIQAPAGEEVILLARGVGDQVYTCQASTDGKFSWVLKAPDANLMDRNNKVLGSHFAGPTWKLKDGSQVTGKVVAKIDSLDPESIPWLLLQAADHSGNGLLATVTSVQRIHTHGGQPPSSGCDEAHRNDEVKSSYSADYYFYHPAK